MIGNIIIDLCLCINFAKVICYCKASTKSYLLKQSENIKSTYAEHAIGFGMWQNIS